MKKSLLVIGSVATIGLASMAGIGLASASSTSQGSLIDKLVAKFHISKTEVQAVFDQQRAQNQAAREAEEKTRLDAAVKAGTLTQTQEDKLIAHEAEEHTFRDSLRDKTDAERKTAMETHRAAEKAWATANGIPAQFEHDFGRRGHGGHGMKGGMPPVEAPAEGTTPATS